MSNFDFLQEKYNSYYELGTLAEQYYQNDPPTAIAKLRLLIEFIVKDIYSENERLDGNLSIYEIISICEDKEYIPEKIVNLLHTVRIKGNVAIHEHKGSSTEALELLKYTHFIAFWFYALRGGDKKLFQAFEKPVSKFEELQKLKSEQENIIKSLQQKLEENQRLLKEKQKSEAEIIDFKRKSAEISKYKEIAISEKQTRILNIDPKLKSLGWQIVDYKENLDLTSLDNIAVRELPTSSGPADYGLFVKGQLLGFIEAKKIKVGAKNVIEQAKRYSQTAINGVGNWRGYQVPFLYSSNGEKVFFLDVREDYNLSRELSTFHTPKALAEFFYREKFDSRKWLSENPIAEYYSNTIKQPYPFQKNAISSIEENIINGKRQLLVAMATGTGKTYTTVSTIYRLLESKIAKRVLFLVDRKALAAQAVTNFYAFETPKGNKFTQEYEVYSQKFRKEDFEENEKKDEKFDINVLPNEYLTDPQQKHTFVYVSTIQRMTLNLQGSEAQNISDEEGNQEYQIEAEQLDIPIHAFDIIIVDECHRGYTSKESNIWRDTIKYFDAVKIGLTATPALHTVSYFGEPVFKYSIEKAVEEGFLVDQNDPILIKSGVRMQGAFLKEGEQVEIIDTETGKSILDSLEDEREYSSTDIEKKITVPDSNRKIIQEIKKYLEEHEKETGRFPKTLVFAVNDLPHTSHADEIVSLCKNIFNRGDDFAVKITGNPNVDRPLQKIREFRNRPNPKIVVTVDMLTTGVDIPSIEFLVFLVCLNYWF